MQSFTTNGKTAVLPSDASLVMMNMSLRTREMVTRSLRTRAILELSTRTSRFAPASTAAFPLKSGIYHNVTTVISLHVYDASAVIDVGLKAAMMIRTASVLAACRRQEADATDPLAGMKG